MIEQILDLIQTNRSVWLLTLAVLFFASFFLLRVFLHFFVRKAKKSKNYWDDLVLYSIKAPLQGMVWYFWLYYTLDSLAGTYPAIISFISILNLFPIVLIAWLLFRFITQFSQKISMGKTTSEIDSIHLIARVIKIIIVLIVILNTAQHFGFSISSILTFGGMGGIIIGFAAKDMLANIFGGLMLQIDKPFSTGDWIRSDEKGFEGVVDKIGWRVTKIITFSKNPVYIPNSIFATIHIETPSRMSNRRIKTIIGLRYADVHCVADIVRDITQYLRNNKNIDQDRTVIVNLNTFNAYSVDCLIYAFTKTTNWEKFHQIKQTSLLEINQIIEKHGAEIAYPTQKIHIQNEIQ